MANFDFIITPTQPGPEVPAAAGGITFGAAKADLATVTANGVCADDPRVLARTNEATKMLLDALIPVGGMAIYDVTANGTELLLPPQLENAIEVEVLNGGKVLNQDDVTEGWYDMVSNFAYVDPSAAHDNPLQDLGLFPDPDDHTVLRRKYNYPGLQNNATVRVTGAKRYLRIVDDNSFLIIQNIPAVKLGILSLEFLERGAGSAEDSEKYRQMAVARLEAEVKKHQLDPRNSLKRKAAYQSDLTFYSEGTLGRTRARLALELTGFLQVGKSEITYLVNRAEQMLIDNRNQLAISGRISVHGSVEELSYAAATKPDTVLAWQDYNEIRLMVQSFIVQDAARTAQQNPYVIQGDAALAAQFQQQAFDSQRAKLIEATEKARHTTYTTALSTYIEGSFGWTVARLALELPNGLSMTTTELERAANMAEMRLMEQGIWKGCLKSLSATITSGEILFPRDVEAMLAADICGEPCDIRSIFFEYQKNGPGKGRWDMFADSFFHLHCGSRFVDEGEVYYPQTGAKRRKYRYRGSCNQSVKLNAICKVRFITKESCDEMVIKNFEAIRLFVQGIIAEKAEKWQDAATAQADAVGVLEKEMNEYLGGIQWSPTVDDRGFGFGDLGYPL